MPRKTKTHTSLLTVVAGALIALSAQAREPAEAMSEVVLKGQYAAVAEYVDDGDTFIARVQGQKFRIRLSDIDAPEVSHCKASRATPCQRMGQPFGVDGGDFLRGAIQGKAVTINCAGYDGKYKRNVCRVYVDGRDVNLGLAASGLAWFNDKYSKDRSIRQAEVQARAGRLGLWSQSSPVQPWVWRDNCWKRGVCPGGI